MRLFGFLLGASIILVIWWGGGFWLGDFAGNRFSG